MNISAQSYLQQIADVSAANMPANYAILKAALNMVLRRDQRRLARQLQRLQNNHKAGSTASSRLLADIRGSLHVVAEREQSLTSIAYPEVLPISTSLESIRSAVEAHQVVIVAGETGSGKTTQLPKLCADMGFGLRGRIGHTQPRRLAARSVAARIADELEVTLGEQVGYQFRFQSQTADATRIKLMTDGILLAEIARDRFLNEYDVLIIDEAHERSLNIDFLLGYLKLLLLKRPDLKVIVTSATIDVQRFAKFFNQAPVLQVPGRSYPVRVEYLDHIEVADSTDGAIGQTDKQIARAEDLPSRVEDALQRIGSDSITQNPMAPDVLVFVPGEREIRELSHSLRKRVAEFEILPLYARLSQAEQRKIFSPNSQSKRRVILATNVAETSVTVPRIGYVIDSGLARISRYSARSKLQRLPVEPISRASAEQRAGRCGRIAAGVCYRLYSEQDFLQRPAFTEPEIQRTNLASVILQMQAMQLGAIERFPFIDPPHATQVRAGLKTLQELNALSKEGELSGIGKKLTQLPVDPRLGRMLLAAKKQGCVDDMLIIVSALAVQDPRENPADKRQAADAAHRRYWHPKSDFISWLNLWHYVEKLREDLTARQFRNRCQREFLSYLKLREWRDVHWQLRIVWREMAAKKSAAGRVFSQAEVRFENNSANIASDTGQPLKRAIDTTEYERLHRSILVGVPLNVGKKEQKGRYRGVRDLTFFLFPGSSQFKSAPPWVIANEIVETQKVYARGVAAIETQWIERDLKHLLKYNFAEPRWDKKRGQVVAKQSTLFYGLLINANRNVNYEQIDAQHARAVFIQQALVEQQLNPDKKLESLAGFWQHNIKTISDVVKMEDKLRRRELLVDDVQLAAFYAQRLPDNICSRTSLMHSLQQDKSLDQRLRLSQADVLLASGDTSAIQQFPDQLVYGGQKFSLRYSFSPGASNDGITARIPLAVLGELPIYIFDWVVPGLLRDKCIDMVKALPKAQRKQLVPVPAVVDKLLSQIDCVKVAMSNAPLAAVLAQKIAALYSVDINALSWRQHCNEVLDPLYRVYFQVVDNKKVVVGEGRDIEILQRDLVEAADTQISQYGQERFLKSNITRWDFGELKEFVEPDTHDMSMRGYPLLEDAKTSVTLNLAATAEEALARSQKGLIRLAMLAMPDKVRYLKKNLCKKPQLLLAYAAIGDREALLDDLIFAAIASSCFNEFVDQIPRNREMFEQCVAKGRPALIAQANTLEQHLHELLAYYQQAIAISREKQKHFPKQCDDVISQLEGLIYAGFLTTTGATHLEHLPRYMKALIYRLENMGRNPAKEIEMCEKLLSADQRLKNLLYNYPYALIFDQQVVNYRWLLEELRVSLFAQHLKTASPISFQRLDKAWAEIEHNRYPLNRR